MQQVGKGALPQNPWVESMDLREKSEKGTGGEKGTDLFSLREKGTDLFSLMKRGHMKRGQIYFLCK